MPGACLRRAAAKSPARSGRSRLSSALPARAVRHLLLRVVTPPLNHSAEATAWQRVVRFNSADRFYARLHSDSLVDVWLLTWLHDQSTDLHDHGLSAAAFTVVRGELLEVQATADAGLSSHRRLPGETTWVAPGVVHDVRHSSGPAISIHAYSPPLDSMTYYEARHGRLEPVRTLDADAPEFEGAR